MKRQIKSMTKAKVIMLDSSRRAFLETVNAIKAPDVKHVCLVVHRGEEEEEYFFWGHPAKIYQMLSLAQAHIVQSQPLLEIGEMTTEDD